MDKKMNYAVRAFTANYAEKVVKTVNPLKMIMLSATHAISEDGSAEIKTAPGGADIRNYQFIMENKGKIYLKSQEMFDAQDNCVIRVGMRDFDGNIQFLKNRNSSDEDHIISTFAWFLLESFAETCRENLGEINVHQPNSAVRIEFVDSF